MLTVVIPALNEEQSIESICRRVLDCAPMLREECGHELEVIVVDDGSTDRTAELARGVEGVRVHSFGHNKGYGAALMAGFEQAAASLSPSSMPTAPAIRASSCLSSRPFRTAALRSRWAIAWVRRARCRGSAGSATSSSPV
jgi:hypothetical protein